MATLRRWIFICSLLLAAELRLWGASPGETQAFNVATQFFRGGFYAQAEGEFARFGQTFTNSTRLAEAILYQARSRLELTNYAGAIELLTSHQGAAGKWADEYLFWLAEAYGRKGDYRTASDGFAKLVKEQPASPRRLEAAVREAAALAKLAEWPRLIEVLDQPDGVFQSAARTNASNAQVLRGYLLLSEAQLAQTNYAAAEAALQPLGKLPLEPKLDWQRQYLLCRIQVAAGHAEEALPGVTNLLQLAVNAASRSLQAESVAFKASLLERLGRAEEAIAVYTNNFAAGVPSDRRQEALLKTTELLLALNRIADAAQLLDNFLSQFSDAPEADLARLTVGELRLRQHYENAVTNAPAATTYLQQALAALSPLAKKSPPSPVLGKAQLDLGWCYWRATNLVASRQALQVAVERLPPSAEQALAYFKLADVQFAQGDFTNALADYTAVVAKFDALPEVKTNLFERALYQAVRAALAANDLPAATDALGKILAWYPNGFHADRAVLLTGQAMSRVGDPAGARAVFLEFLKRVPEAPLLPELQLAIARTYEQENKWPEAIGLYDGWLARFTNHAARPGAEYNRAWAYSQAGDETNALTQFTNFIAQFPTSEFAPLAQWWAADYYRRVGDAPGLTDAEINFHLIFENTNWPPSEIKYQAEMMAGRVAVTRQGWQDAIRYFTNLTSNPKCPPDLWVQAMFAYGDALMGRDSTNKPDDYSEALGVFSKICESYPTNQLAVLAKANCYLQWALASRRLEQDTNAANTFQQVVDSRRADAAARSQAKVGLALVFKKQAEQKSGAEQRALLEQALTNCLDVLYGKILREGEPPDPFWTKEAGLEAGRLAETLQAWAQARNVYQQMAEMEMFRTLGPFLKKRILKAQENLDRAEN